MRSSSFGTRVAGFGEQDAAKVLRIVFKVMGIEFRVSYGLKQPNVPKVGGTCRPKAPTSTPFKCSYSRLKLTSAKNNIYCTSPASTLGRCTYGLLSRFLSNLL